MSEVTPPVPSWGHRFAREAHPLRAPACRGALAANGAGIFAVSPPRRHATGPLSSWRIKKLSLRWCLCTRFYAPATSGLSVRQATRRSSNAADSGRVPYPAPPERLGKIFFKIPRLGLAAVTRRSQRALLSTQLRMAQGPAAVDVACCGAEWSPGRYYITLRICRVLSDRCNLAHDLAMMKASSSPGCRRRIRTARLCRPEFVRSAGSGVLRRVHSNMLATRYPVSTTGSPNLSLMSPAGPGLVPGFVVDGLGEVKFLNL